VRVALVLAYDGGRYFGYVRQPGRVTVESVVIGAMEKLTGGLDLRGSRYRVATRTDRGVSALGQVIALDLQREIEEEELNRLLPDDIAVLSVAEVRENFNPRVHAYAKHYRYVCEAPEGFDLRAARNAAWLLEGVHDFAAFCRRESGRRTVAELERAIVRKAGSTIVMDFIAHHFLWQQVRRMVTAIVSAGCGRLDPDELREILERPEGRGIRPASPDGLFLVEVKYRGMRFPIDAAAKRRFLSYLSGSERLVCRAMAEMLNNKL